MRDTSNYISFKADSILPISKKNDDLWFVFKDNQLMIIKTEDSIRIPTYKDLKNVYDIFNKKFYLGDLNSTACFCTELKEISDKYDFSFMSLRESSAFISPELFQVCGRAFQILHWDNNTNFCGRCGSKISIKDNEFSKYCPDCNLVTYPRISPAIIVAVTKANEILLAHNKNFPDGLHSIIAGFVDPCETLEDCVRREVFEEVGIKVKNIKYFGSQPWPYPDSLMIGFFAEYEEGEINVDGEEITDAHWFSKENLPLLPLKTSIARKLIDNFLTSCN